MDPWLACIWFSKDLQEKNSFGGDTCQFKTVQTILIQVPDMCLMQGHFDIVFPEPSSFVSC